MKQKIGWGILGCGRIAGKFAEDLKLVPDAELVAVGSREQQNADAFCRKYPARFSHGSYEALVQNPEVDVIYVASPHALHHEHTLLCLRHGKHVLCEKAFAINLAQAREMVQLAQEKGLFLMEALWTKFMPHYRKLREMIAAGELGTIQNVLVNFGFKPEPPIPKRLLDPTLGGGTILDIGIYNVFIAMAVLGKPDEIDASMTPADTGIDLQCAVTFRYRNGALAQLFSTFSSNLAIEADISGDKGRIRLTTRFYEPSTQIEFYPGRVDSRTIIPVEKNPGWGYHYEIGHVNECLRKGLRESPVMSHADTLELMEVLDQIRSKAGIIYPADQT
jgi:predicted dehydrogenase